MKFEKKISILAATIAILAAGTGAAQVTVSHVIMTFRASDRPVTNVSVGNSSDQAAYVVATVEKVLNPETGGDKTEQSEDVLASPKTFSIEARGQRTVRLLLRSSPKEREAVYRVLFTPQDRGFGQEIKQERGGRVASIRVLTGMGVLLFAEPPNPLGKLDWSRNADSVVFRNLGNVHVELAEGKACKDGACSPVDRKRVYPSTTFEVKSAGDREISYVARTGSMGVFENFIIPPLKDETASGVFSPSGKKSGAESGAR